VVVVVRRIARALLTEFTQILPLFPDTCGQALPSSLEESELDADMSNWLNFRRLDALSLLLQRYVTCYFGAGERGG
jgi:hypothetical protein